MMSLTKISSASAQHYYAKEDYYTNSAEAREASAWSGEGAKRAGLTGSVVREQFREVLDGQLPDGKDLARNGGDERRAGFDATFSAPKSVSLLAEVGGDASVLEAHRIATRAGLTYLQEHASYARITENGETRLEQTGNLIIATFEHHTSRSGDPQTHTHSVIMNATQRADDEWRALAGEKLYEAKMTAGAVYRATLANEMQELGYHIEVTHADGRFEVAGLTKEQLNEFSQRSQDIREAMAEYGLSGAKEAERATLLTRESKKETDLGQLREEWKARALEHGMDLKGMVLQAQERVGISTDRTVVSLQAKEAVEWSIEHTTERQTLVRGMDLQRHAAERVVGKASFSDVQHALALEERNGNLIRVGDRYTTIQALSVEHQTIEKMKEGQNSIGPVMDRQQADLVLSGHGLTAGQERAASHILTSSDRFIGVEGWAGTGKTTMLQRVQEVVSNSRIELRGLAVSASAARTLETESGIPSETVAQFLSRAQSSNLEGVQRAYVIDEASLLGARTALALMERVGHENARATFLGDLNQLASIEAGKPFAVLVSQGMNTERMDEILRQRDPELKSLVEQAAQGRTAETVGQLEQSGRLIAVSDRNERLNMVAQEYLRQTSSEQEQTLVLTGSRVDREALNEMIRSGLQQQGILSGSEMRSDVLVQKDFTKSQLREAASYESGNVVRFGKDYRGLGIMKGEYGVVEDTSLGTRTVSLRMESNGRAVDWQPDRHVAVEVFQKEQRGVQDGDVIRWTKNDYSQERRNGELVKVSIDTVSGRVSVHDKNGKETDLNLDTDRHWDHGYVSTIHASQGQTADRTIFHADSQQLATNREGWYVAVSRAREDLRVVTDDVASLKEAVGESRAQQSAIEAVEKHSVENSKDRGSDRDLAGTSSAATVRQAELER